MGSRRTTATVVKLLQLQEGMIRRVGSPLRPVNVRIVAAVQNLPGAVKRVGLERLVHRLNVKRLNSHHCDRQKTFHS